MVAIVPQSERDLDKVVYSLRQVTNDFNFIGTWTPVLTFATPGDLAVTYSAQEGLYMKLGRFVIAKFSITTSAFTFGTASGNLTITGLPVAPVDLDGRDWRCGVMRFQGITKANYTQIVPVAVRSTTTMIFDASGSAQSLSQVTAANMPSGGSVDLRGEVFYMASL